MSDSTTKNVPLIQAKLKDKHDWLDLTGTAVSWICLVHCIALPFCVSLLPLVGLSFLLDEKTEWAIISLSLLVAAFSLLPAYFRRHRQIRTLILFVSGVGLIIITHLVFEENRSLQIPFLLAGAGLITAAHLVNRRLCRTCGHCRTLNREKQVNKPSRLCR